VGVAALRTARASDDDPLAVVRRVASEVGLHVTSAGYGGAVLGVPVTLALHRARRLAVVRVHASFETALDLGVDLRTRDRPTTGMSAVVEGDLAVRALDPDFDERFELAGLDPPRALKLLTQGLRDALRAVAPGTSVELDDRGVTLGVSLSKHLDAAALRAALDHAARIAGEVETARRRVPAPADCAGLVAGFEAASRELGLAFASTPFELVGRIGEVYVRVTPLREGGPPQEILVRAAFPRLLGAGLRIEPSRSLDQTGEALEIERTFDRTFHVYALDELLAQRVLSDSVRAELLRMGDRVRGDDEGLSLRAPTQSLDRTIPELAALAASMAALLRPDTDASPYR
jgi:hypothetical protein